jgi:hypothetical protein
MRQKNNKEADGKDPNYSDKQEVPYSSHSAFHRSRTYLAAFAL